MAAIEPGEDSIGKDSRLAALDARLKAAAEAEQVRTGTAPSQARPDEAYRRGSRVLAELIAGPAGGALLGWFLDRLFGTSPWLLLALLVLGTAGAFWNIVKNSR